MLPGGYHWSLREDGALLQLRYGTAAKVTPRSDGQFDVLVLCDESSGRVELRGRAATLKMGIRHVERCINARREYPYKRYLASLSRRQPRQNF